MIETVSNDANGNQLSALKRGEELRLHREKWQGNDATVTYDKMVAIVVVSTA